MVRLAILIIICQLLSPSVYTYAASAYGTVLPFEQTNFSQKVKFTYKPSRFRHIDGKYLQPLGNIETMQSQNDWPWNTIGTIVVFDEHPTSRLVTNATYSRNPNTVYASATLIHNRYVIISAHALFNKGVPREKIQINIGGKNFVVRNDIFNVLHKKPIFEKLENDEIGLVIRRLDVAIIKLPELIGHRIGWSGIQYMHPDTGEMFRYEGQLPPGETLSSKVENMMNSKCRNDPWLKYVDDDTPIYSDDPTEMIKICSAAHWVQSKYNYDKRRPFSEFKLITGCGIVGLPSNYVYSDNCPPQPGISGHPNFYIHDNFGPLIVSYHRGNNCRGENYSRCISLTEAQELDSSNYGLSIRANVLYKELNIIKAGGDPFPQKTGTEEI